MTSATILRNTQYGQLKARADNRTIYWAENGVWENWPRLVEAGIIRADYGNSSNMGHIDLYLV